MDAVQPGQQSDAALPGILLGALDVLTVERRGPEAVHGQRQLRIFDGHTGELRTRRAGDPGGSHDAVVRDVQRCRESGRPVASLRGHPLLRRQHERSGDRSLDRPAGVGEGADAVQWDHAVKEGTVMRSLIVPALVIANPAVGAPLMLRNQTMGIDLPMKALAWEDERGQVWLTYNAPAYLAERHGVSGSTEALEAMRKGLERL